MSNLNTSLHRIRGLRRQMGNNSFQNKRLTVYQINNKNVIHGSTIFFHHPPGTVFLYIIRLLAYFIFLSSHSNYLNTRLMVNYILDYQLNGIS